MGLSRVLFWRVAYARFLLKGRGPFWNAPGRTLIPGYQYLWRAGEFVRGVVARVSGDACGVALEFPRDDGRNAGIRLEVADLLDRGLYHGVRLDPAWFLGATVVDAGAYIGAFSIWALRHGAARVVAFEPDTLNADVLRRNLQSCSGNAKATVVTKALWSSSGTQVLVGRGPLATLCLSSPQGRHADSSHVGRTLVPVTTLDEWVATASPAVKTVDVLKLDVEGAESQVLLGAAHVIKAHRPRIIACVYHFRSQGEEVLRAIRSLRGDYKCSFHGNGFWYSDADGAEVRPALLLAE